MKKLMTMIAAVATAFGLYATDTGTSFEGVEAEGTLESNTNVIKELPDFQATALTYWANLDDTAVIKARDVAFSNRPEQYDGQANIYCLELATGTKVIERYAKAGGGTTRITDGNLFFDSVVNMTAFEDEPTIPTDAKIAVWLQDTSDIEEATPATNLVVTINGENYIADGNWESILETWARVTVKALKLGNGKIGFVVFVNSTIVTCTDLAYDMTGYNDNAKQYAGMKALFPFAGDDTTIKAAGFAGKGSVDDLVFTETPPSFDYADDFKFFTLGWDTTSVASVEDFTANPTNLLVDGLQKTYTYVAQEGYINGSTNITGEAGKTYTITAAKLGASVLKWDAETEQWVAVQGGQVSTFANALALVDNSGKFKIELGQDEGAITIDKTDCDITLDLAGHEITQGNADAAINVSAGTLTIIDSIGDGVVSANTGLGANAAAVLAWDGVLAINAGQYDGLVNGSAIITIMGGKFLASANEKNTLDAWKPEGYEFVAKDGYWELKEITGYTLSIDPNIVNGTVTTVPAASKVEAGTTVTVTATPADGYNLGSITTNDATIAGNTFVMPEDNVVVSATFVAIQYATLTVAMVENLTISVTNAAGEVQNTGAKFDKDLATVLYVTRTPASGYELDGYVATETITMSADVTVTGAVKSAAQPVKPGEEKQYDDPQKAADAAKAINDNKEASINVPAEAADNKTAYLARVAAKVLADGLTVVVDIAADKEATFKTELDTEIKKDTVAAALTDATATKATIATVAGFYYWIEGGVEVGTIKTNGDAVIGTGSTVELTKPALGPTTKAFYKLAVGVKAP